MKTDKEILFNQIKTDISELAKDVKAGLYKGREKEFYEKRGEIFDKMRKVAEGDPIRELEVSFKELGMLLKDMEKVFGIKKEEKKPDTMLKDIPDKILNEAEPPAVEDLPYWEEYREEKIQSSKDEPDFYEE